MSAKSVMLTALETRDGHTLKHTHIEIVDTIIDALAAAGYAIVSVEPAEAMYDAFYSCEDMVGTDTRHQFDKRYRAFIAAVAAAKETK